MGAPHRVTDNKISRMLLLIERRILLRALRNYGGVARKAAEMLEINRTDFYKRMQRCGIPPNHTYGGNAAWKALGKESAEELKLIANRKALRIDKR